MRWPGQLISKLICSGILLAAAVLLSSEPALAAKRVALIIGNSAYQNAPQLPNPVNDAALMAATFKSAGFDVVDSRQNLSALDTRRVLREFADSAQDADIAVVYYAGHGLEVDGTNYLVPVDAKLERDTDVYDEALSLDRLLIAVEPAKQLRLVILDACRDNPFVKNMKRAVASRSIDRGLAKIEPSSSNMLIAYSAKAGSTAADGDSKNSPFSIALSRHLTTPGLDVRKAFGYVRDDVLKATANRQEPFVYGSLGGDEFPLVPTKVSLSVQQPAAAEPPAANPQAEARRDYELALQIGNKSAFNAFLAQYPDGFYASLARLQLDRLVTEEAHALAEQKAKAAEAERARLAAAGAAKDAQAKADADARAAEQARLATEQAQQAAQAQAAEAERNRIATLAAAAPAATPAPAAATPSPSRATSVASLDTGSPQGDLTRSLQSELRRVGCLTTSTDGDWNAASQRSLTQFNRYSGTKFDTKTASIDALDAVKQKGSRVCPLSCEHGFKADGDQCTRIVCAEGSFLNDDNQCEKRRDKKPVASRDRQDTPRERPQAQQAPQAPQPKQSMAGRPAGAFSSSPPPARSSGRPLTGAEREEGCNSYQAIMSGVCP
jgi:uncharacterized caspase-like protein